MEKILEAFLILCYAWALRFPLFDLALRHRIYP
jgi:hypothetical protein